MCIGVSPYGLDFPIPPPRQYSATAPRVPAPPPLQRQSQVSKPNFRKMLRIHVLNLSLLLHCYFFYVMNKNMDPTFRVESVTVSLQDSKWIVGFSVKNDNLSSKLYYKYINVSIEETTSSSSSNKYFSTAVIPPFTQSVFPNNTKLINATIVASWPDYKPGLDLCEYGLIFMTRIKFGAKYEYSSWPRYVRYSSTLELECEDVKLGFLSSPTQAVLLGGPAECRKVQVVGK